MHPFAASQHVTFITDRKGMIIDDHHGVPVFDRKPFDGQVGDLRMIRYCRGIFVRARGFRKKRVAAVTRARRHHEYGASRGWFGGRGLGRIAENRQYRAGG